MEYQDHVARLHTVCPELANQLTSFTNLRHVLEWMSGKGLALDDVDVIAQDEFNHDFVFRCNGDDEFLVFGMS